MGKLGEERRDGWRQGAWQGGRGSTGAAKMPVRTLDDIKKESSASGGPRVVRGASWVDENRFARCAARSGVVADLFSFNVGFRVVLSLANSES